MQRTETWCIRTSWFSMSISGHHHHIASGADGIEQTFGRRETFVSDGTRSLKICQPKTDSYTVYEPCHSRTQLTWTVEMPPHSAYTILSYTILLENSRRMQCAVCCGSEAFDMKRNLENLQVEKSATATATTTINYNQLFMAIHPLFIVTWWKIPFPCPHNHVVHKISIVVAFPVSHTHTRRRCLVVVVRHFTEWTTEQCERHISKSIQIRVKEKMSRIHTRTSIAA